MDTLFDLGGGDSASGPYRADRPAKKDPRGRRPKATEPATPERYYYTWVRRTDVEDEAIAVQITLVALSQLTGWDAAGPTIRSIEAHLMTGKGCTISTVNAWAQGERAEFELQPTRSLLTPPNWSKPIILQFPVTPTEEPPNDRD